MLNNFKQTVKKHESDIFLTVIILSIALVSFGAGLLIDFSEDNQSIIIQNPTASIQQSLTNECQISEESNKQNKFIGSVNSNKYHWPDCPWAKKIGEQNRIWFDSEQEAKNAGYVRCGSFEKYYKP